jgi:PAS domain S-box-containing protein
MSNPVDREKFPPPIEAGKSASFDSGFIMTESPGYTPTESFGRGWLAAVFDFMNSRRAACYVAGVALPLLALMVRFSLPVDIAQRPLLVLYIPVVIVVALTGGLGPGLLATLVTAITTAVAFTMSPTGPSPIGNIFDLFQWLVVILTGAMVSGLAEQLHRARQKAIARQQEAEAASRENLLLCDRLRRHAATLESEMAGRRQAEARIRRLVDSNIIGVVFWSRAGAITEANDTFLALLGYSREDLQSGKIRWSDMTPPEWRAANARALDELEASGTCRPYEKEYVRKDGGRVPVLVAGATFEESSEQGVAFVLDLTERKRAEAALNESRARFEAILGSALEAIVTVDVEQRVVYFNPAAEQLFGWTAEEAAGASLDRFIPARFRDAHRDHLRRFSQDGFTHRVMGTPMEVYGLRRDGEEFPVDAAISRGDAGGQRLMTVMLRDATERKRAETELRLHREHLEDLVVQRTAELTALQEHLAVELADLQRLHRLSTRLLVASEPAPLLYEVLQASIELLGADKGKLQRYDKRDNMLKLVAQIGFDQAFIDTFSAVPPFSAICGTALGLRERVIVENCLTDSRFTENRALYVANGVVGMQATPLYGSDGELYGVLTTHFRAPHQPSERELRLLDLYAQQATRVIENTERGEQLALAKVKAEEADRLKSVFLTTMSHELRTPLNAILGYAQILGHDPSLGERQAEGLNTIRQSGEYLLTLINDILDLSKIEAGRFTLNPAPIKLPPFLQAVAETVAVKAEQKGLGFIFDAAPDLPEAAVFDERRLRQVLLNLLGNAVNFTDQGQVILRVRSQTADGEQLRLRFEIEDTGIGIAAEQLEVIFHPFEQVGATQGRSGSTGLGLAISRQLVRLMGSDIRAESEPGRGSRFWFEFLAPLVGDAAAAAAPAEGAVIGYDGDRRKLLVADDVAANRRMLAELLRSLGFEVCEAADGPEAVALVQTERPDLVLMDVMMPLMAGPEATRRIHELPGCGALPVFAVSAGAASEEQARSLAAGACAFIPKPIDHKLLLDLIGSRLNLTWIEAPTPAVSTGPLLAPPPEEMEILRRLALTGNMRDIRQRSEHIRALDPRYVPFADRLHDLARRYQSQAILALVRQHL